MRKVCFFGITLWLAAQSLSSALGVQGTAFAKNGASLRLKVVEASGLMDLPLEKQKEILRAMKQAGSDAVLTEAFAFPPSPVILQKDPETLDPAGLSALSRLARAAHEEQVGLFLILSADTSPRGGKERYAAWAGSSNPNVFYFDFRCRKWFLNHLEQLLTFKPKGERVSLGRHPAVWGWVLVDRPENSGAGEDKERHEQIADWIQEAAGKVAKLSPGKLRLVRFSVKPRGFDPLKVGLLNAVDGVLLDGPIGREAEDVFQRKLGKPLLVRLSDKVSLARAGHCAGAWVAARTEGNLEAELSVWWRAYAAPSPTSPAVWFEKIEAKAVNRPILRNEAKVEVSVILKKPAALSVRFRQGDAALQAAKVSTQALQHRLTLEGLLAGEVLEYQVVLRDPAKGETVFSEMKRFSVPKLEPYRLEPLPPSKDFIQVSGTQFLKNGRPWRYVGGNCYYLHYYPPESSDYVFSNAAALGMEVMRVGTFGETDRYEKSSPDEKKKYFVIGPGKYVEAHLRNLDRVIADAGRHGIRVIFTFTDNWKWFGGAEVWARFFGYEDKNDFYDKPEVKKAFKEHIRTMVNRVNTVSGKRYGEDPTIFAWDLINEARYERDPSGKVLSAWYDEMAAYLKSLGIRQLVTSGSEGAFAEGGTHYSGSDFVKIHASPHLDFATFHIYPSSEYNQWNWPTTKSLLERYVHEAHQKLKKPVVMEEYGIMKNLPKYDRPIWIERMVRAFYDAGGNGSNYWMLVEPSYTWGEGNEFDPTQLEIANIFAWQAGRLRKEFQP